jgi:hypothetical protein
MVRKSRSTTASLQKLAELSIAAPQVVAIRTARMMAAGAQPDARDRAEFARMSTEKVQAFWESMFGMGRQMILTNQEYASRAFSQWTRVWMTPWWLNASLLKSGGLPRFPRWSGSLLPTRTQQRRAISKVVAKGLAPVHKRATANARRLKRLK